MWARRESEPLLLLVVVGKVFDEETKQFVSCCVRVSGLERNLFFLPRQGGDGEEPAEIMNVYNEVSSILQSDVTMALCSVRVRLSKSLWNCANHCLENSIDYLWN